MAYFVSLTHYAKLFGFESVGSHGCIRLEENNAKTLFRWAPMHTVVVVY